MQASMLNELLAEAQIRERQEWSAARADAVCRSWLGAVAGAAEDQTAAATGRLRRRAVRIAWLVLSGHSAA
jgi:hypothetical protein